MGDEPAVDEVKEELATAVGLLALTDCSLHKAASRAGLTQLEVENALEGTELADRLDIDLDGDVAAEIDSLLDDHS